MKFRKGRFTVQLNGGPKEVNGYLANDVFGWIGIHKHGKLWNITHLITGHKMAEENLFKKAKDRCINILDTMVSLEFKKVGDLSTSDRKLLKNATLGTINNANI